jgi:multiple sugar transport system substrate-binding protein
MGKIKKLISAVLTSVMFLSVFAGCGKNEGNSSSQQQDLQTSKANVETTTAKEEKEVKLTWALWDYEKTPYYKALIEEYKKIKPNVTIKYKDLGSSNYQTVLGTQLAGEDSGLDILSVKDIPGYSAMVNAGQLEDLSDFIKKYNIDTSKYSGTTEQIAVDGKLYALPFRSDFWVVFYNKDLFDKAGVAYPTNDMTMKDYDAIARKMTSGSGSTKVYGAHYHTWRSAVQLFGILDGKHTILDPSTGYDFLKPYYEIILKEQDDGIVQDYATLKTSSTHYSGVFENNSVAMLNMGSWFISTLINDIKTGKSEAKNWGIVKYPHPEGVAAGTTLGTITTLGVASSSKNKDAALDFINFVCGEEGAKVIASTGTFPAIKTDDILEKITSLEGFPKDENSKEALKTVKTYLEMPMNPNSAQIETILNDQHDAIMTKSVSIEEGLKEMTEQVKAIIG